MNPQIRLLMALFAGIAILSPSISLCQSATKPESTEYLLLGSPNRGAGEPWVAVNPKDPNNIIVAAMATLNRLPTGELPYPRDLPYLQKIETVTWTSEWTKLRVKELSVPDGSRTDIAITRDGGKTWSFTTDDIRKIEDMNRCSDSFAGVSPDGTLYVGCLAYLKRNGSDYAEGFSPHGEARTHHGGSVIEWSKDEGNSWSHPVMVHPAVAPSLFPPTVHPVIEQVSPFDRPDFVSDPTTGTIYLSGKGLTYTVAPATLPPPPDPSKPGKGFTGYPPANVTRRRGFVRASKDGGQTWGMIYPMDSDEYPGAGGGYSAAFGHLAVAYNATRVPESGHAKCPCTVLGISDDQGKSFTYHVVPPLPDSDSEPATGNPMRGWYPAVPPAGSGSELGGSATHMPAFLFDIVMVAADPTKAGRYAVAREHGNRILISITEDAGKIWQAPVIAAELPQGVGFQHQAMKYSPKGDLGLIWKAIYPNGSYDLWSSASLDGAKSFKTVRVSHSMSPPCDPERCNFMLGDDLSSMDIDGKYLYAVWGDNRSGFEGTWFGRVPLSAY